MDKDTANPLETAIAGYFRAPDPHRLIALFAAQPVDERWRAETVLTLPVFFGHLMDQAPDAAPALVEAAKGGDPVKIEVVAQALNYAHIATRRTLMERLAGEAAAGAMDLDGADFTDFQPSHPVHVDMLWASFFATGRPVYIERIAALLAGWIPTPELQALLSVAGRDASVREKALAGVLADAALWSLTVNARDMAEVNEALTAYAASAEGLAAAMAARILAGLKQTAAASEN